MVEPSRQLTFQVDLDDAVTEDEIAELRSILHKAIDEWCCGDSATADFHRTTAASSQLAFIDPN